MKDAICLLHFLAVRGQMVELGPLHVLTFSPAVEQVSEAVDE